MYIDLKFLLLSINIYNNAFVKYKMNQKLQRWLCHRYTQKLYQGLFWISPENKRTNAKTKLWPEM